VFSDEHRDPLSEGQYHYVVGNILCTNVINEPGKEIKREVVAAELWR
jgi:hypothetical protein